MKVNVKATIKYEEENVKIKGEFIKLDSLLKFANLAETGGDSKLMIQDGLVKVNGEICTKRGKKIHPGDIVCQGHTKLIIEGKE